MNAAFGFLFVFDVLAMELKCQFGTGKAILIFGEAVVRILDQWAADI
jgi:hypothetical protein